MKATITLQDGEAPGTFKVDTDYEGGFQVGSHAHQHALLLIKHLGSLAERHGDTVATEVRGSSPDLVENLARAMDEPAIPAVPVDASQYVESVEPASLNG